jgi:dimethylamine monooxygenase subunit A
MAILQDRLPVAPWMAAHTLRLPGTGPIDPADWLQRDDAFAPQMACRDRLIAERPEAVHAMTDPCRPGAEELLAVLLDHLARDPGYVREGEAIRRPDGVLVPLVGPPLLVAGRLVQEDLCLLDKPEGGDEHLLTGAILCFPSNWTLAQKLGHPLSRIHLPIEVYDATMARRVQRLLDLLRPEAPLMRANLLLYGEPALFNPRPEFARHTPEPGGARFVRVERQVLLRLPASRAVVFSIHTYMVRPEALTPEQRARLEAVRPEALARAISNRTESFDG